MTNGELHFLEPDLDFHLDQINGEFKNNASGEMQDFEVFLQELKIHNEFVSLHGKSELRNFDEPKISMNFRSEVDLKELPTFLSDSLRMEFHSGRLSLNVQYERQRTGWEDLRIQDVIFSKTIANYRLADVEIEVKPTEKILHISTGSGAFNNNDLRIDSLQMKFDENKFYLSLEFEKFFSFLGMNDTTRLYKASLNAKSDYLRLEDLLREREKIDGDASKFPKNFSINSVFKIDSLSYKNFYATDMRAAIIFIHDTIHADYIDFNSFDGAIEMNVQAFAEDFHYKVFCDAEIKNASISDLFYQMDDFGQEEIQSDNVNGTLNAEIHFESALDKSFRILKDSLYALADFSVFNGQLNNFEPIVNSLSFLGEEELQLIDFETFRNQIEVKNRMIIIPNMEIKSSVIDFEAYGTHSFDNRIDYHIRVLLSDILSKKARQKEEQISEFGYIEEEEYGRTSLFFNLGGTASDPEFAYDTKAVGRKIKKDFIREKENFANAFKDEFHWLARDPEKKKQKEKRREWIRKQEEGKFLFEWGGKELNEDKQKMN